MFENAGNKLKVAITAIFIISSLLIFAGGVWLAFFLSVPLGILGIIIGVLSIPIGILLLYISFLFVATYADIAEDVKYIAKHLPTENPSKSA